MITGLQTCLSQRPLRCSCTEGHNVRDLNRPLSVGKNVAVVIVPSTPPAGGAYGSGAQEDSQTSENHPYSHRKT